MPTPYPIVIAVTYLGLLFVGLGVSIFSAARLFAVSTLAVAVVSSVLNVVMGDRNRGGLLCLVLVFAALFGSDPRVIAVVLIVASLVVVERIISLRRQTRVPWRTITLVGNVVATIQVVTLVITGIGNGAWSLAADDLSRARATFAAAETAPQGSPDIYVILLDGYERPNKMEAVLGYDDSGFVDALEARGFDVATGSRSNYLLTALSLPSLLNMRHVNDLFDAKPFGDGRYRATVRSFSADNAVFDAMHRLGYETAAIQSGFEEVVIRSADHVIDTGELNEYEVLMARETAVGGWINSIAPSFFGDSQRARVNATLAATADLARGSRDRPLFTFAHVPAPHGPIVFGPDGEAVSSPPLGKFFEDTAHGLGLGREEFAGRYVGQIRYLNTRVLATVDAILAASPRPPVIVLLSDHGSGSGLDWFDLAHSDLDERSANLVAAYTPGHDAVFPDDITLVNVFGKLLGAYFGIEVAEQPDTLYAWNHELTGLVAVPMPSVYR